MNESISAATWKLATTAAAIFAVDPAALAVRLRARPGPARTRWLEYAQRLTDEQHWRVVPPGITDDSLLGGIDLAATLKSGRPIARPGLLADADGDVLLLTMSERATPELIARITAAMDQHAVVIARDGIQERRAARFGIVAIDEGADADECPAAALTDRLAIWLDLSPITLSELRHPFEHDTRSIERARRAYRQIETDATLVSYLCEVAAVLGIDSLRAPLAAVRAARAAAALRGSVEVMDVDVQLAVALTFGPRATRMPENTDEAETPPQQEHDTPAPDSNAADDESGPSSPLTDDDSMLEMLIRAASVSLPTNLLEQVSQAQPQKTAAPTRGRSGAQVRGRGRGRAAGSRHGALQGNAQLDLLATLRTAAPWQPLRRRSAEPAAQSRVIVHPDDFRIARLVHRTETTTVFVVDASGSAALHRMAEAKGACELLLSRAYARRDNVALIAFSGNSADVLLPPTRSLVRARRCLAELPAGGGTPLAAGLLAAGNLARSVARRGGTPTLVVLSDGRANIGLDGSPGRTQAVADAISAANSIRAEQIGALWIDTSKWPDERAQQISTAMGAHFLTLPRADAATISRAVSEAA